MALVSLKREPDDYPTARVTGAPEE